MIRRFRLYGDNERALVKKALDGHLEEWSREWLGNALTLSASVNAADHLPSHDCRKWHCLSCDAFAIAYSWSSGSSQRISAASGWCYPSADSSESLIWEAAVLDLADSLGSSILAMAVRGDCQVVECEPGEEWTKHASGWLLYDVDFGVGTLTLMLSPAFVENLLGSVCGNSEAATLGIRMDAVANGVCRLEVVAGGAEVTIGELHALSPGCVIPLDTIAGQPFGLRTEDGREIGSGYLAACGVSKAICLAAK